jgi:hypothetical protein
MNLMNSNPHGPSVPTRRTVRQVRTKPSELEIARSTSPIHTLNLETVEWIETRFQGDVERP